MVERTPWILVFFGVASSPRFKLGMVWQGWVALDGRQERWAWEVDCALIKGAMGFHMGLQISRRIFQLPGGTGAMTLVSKLRHGVYVFFGAENSPSNRTRR